MKCILYLGTFLIFKMLSLRAFLYPLQFLFYQLSTNFCPHSYILCSSYFCFLLSAQGFLHISRRKDSSIFLNPILKNFNSWFNMMQFSSALPARLSSLKTFDWWSFITFCVSLILEYNILCFSLLASTDASEFCYCRLISFSCFSSAIRFLIFLTSEHTT